MGGERGEWEGESPPRPRATPRGLGMGVSGPGRYAAEGQGGVAHAMACTFHCTRCIVRIVVDGTRRVVGGAQFDPESESEPGSGVIRNDLPLASVPRVAVTRAALGRLSLDHRAGFILWLVDGKSSIADIFDACPLPADEAGEILRSLLGIGVIALE